MYKMLCVMRRWVLVTAGALLLSTLSHAGIPPWTFTPLTPTTISVPVNGSATVKYRVTNQSKKTHTLAMIPIPGISQNSSGGNCTNPFALKSQQACTLTLIVNGSRLRGNISDGPIVCQANPNGTPNPTHCYRPSEANILNISIAPAPTNAIISAKPTTLSFIVGGNGSITVMNTAASKHSADNIKALIPRGSQIKILSSTCPKNLPIGGNCIIKFTSNSVEGPSIISIEGSNTNKINIPITVTSGRATITVNPTRLSFIVGSTGSVQVTNSASSTQPAKNVRALIPIGSNITILSSTCPVNLASGANCTINFTSTIPEGPTTVPIEGVNTNRANVAITVNPVATTILSISVSNLALKTSGVARVITVLNSGSQVANNVNYSLSPAFPTGTTITPSRCGTINPGQTCVLTITPGSIPTAPPGNLTPTPVTLTIAGANTNTVTAVINILAYGSVYQSGFVFDIDDTTPNTGSIGGKGVALMDQAAPSPNGIIWSSNGSGGTSGDVDFFNIPGIYETSVSPPDACNGNIDGACNSTQIINHYSSVNLNFYAVGLCRQYAGGGFTDWYLPAICEMGFDAINIGTGCGTQTNPLLQNIQSNLVSTNIVSLSGIYWSSTEYSQSPTDFAWYQEFGSNASTQFVDLKFGTSGVRCVRALLP